MARTWAKISSAMGQYLSSMALALALRRSATARSVMLLVLINTLRLDMCIGSRFITHEGFQTSFMRRVGIRFLSGMIRLLCGRKVLDVTSGFRATNAEMTAFFARHYATDYPEPEAILAASLAGYRVGEAPVVMHERLGGVSSISAVKSVYYMVKVSLSLVIDRLAIKRSLRGK